MKLKILEHQGRLGADQYRVIRPATPVTGAVLGDNNPWFVLELGADAAFTIAGLWMLAACPAEIARVVTAGFAAFEQRRSNGRSPNPASGAETANEARATAQQAMDDAHDAQDAALTKLRLITNRVMVDAAFALHAADHRFVNVATTTPPCTDEKL